MACKEIVVSRLPQIIGHIHAKGLAALKACAEECQNARGRHSFVNLSLTGGGVKADYCAYCLTYRVNGSVQFDPMTAKNLPTMQGDAPKR